MVPRRSFLAELFAPHEKGSQQQYGSFASDVASGIGSQNYYDPDRARFQQELAGQMNGPGAIAGQGNEGDYGLGPDQNPYSPGPGINNNLGTFGQGGQPIGNTGQPPPGGTPPGPSNTGGGGDNGGIGGSHGSEPIYRGRALKAGSSALGQPGTAGATGTASGTVQGVQQAGTAQDDGRGQVIPPGDGRPPTQTVPPRDQIGSTNPAAPQGGLAGQRDQSGNLIFSGLANMLADPNIPQGTKDAIQQQGALTARAGFAGANEAINRNAAATGNAGGAASAIGQTGRAQAGTLSDLDRQNNIAFEQEKERRKETALSGLSNYYGQASSNYNTLAGIRGGLAGAPVGSQTGARNLTKGINTSNTNQQNVNWI